MVYLARAEWMSAAGMRQAGSKSYGMKIFGGNPLGRDVKLLSKKTRAGEIFV